MKRLMLAVLMTAFTIGSAAAQATCESKSAKLSYAHLHQIETGRLLIDRAVSEFARGGRRLQLHVDPLSTDTRSR